MSRSRDFLCRHIPFMAADFRCPRLALLLMLLCSSVVAFSQAPTISSVSPMGGVPGTQVTITGTNFGPTQGTSIAAFNGTTATPSSWSATSITVPVPTGATSGNLVVTVGGIASNGVIFTVATANFSPTGSLGTARMFHTATLLITGMVLVAGGVDGFAYDALPSAEVYNPATATFTATGNLNTARIFNTATLLTSGKVLIAGGCDSNWNNIANPAELYDPASGTFTFTGSLNTARNSQTATLLNSGKVLIAGGVDSNGDFITSLAAGGELYDPATGSFTPTGSLNTARDTHTATLLNNGTVLIAGGLDVNGNSLASAELYDPVAGTFTPTGSLNIGRAVHTATLLNDGRVLIAGGYDTNGNAVASAELYDPVSGTFTVTGSLNTPRYDGTQGTLLNNGLVLIAGGQDNNGNTLATVELYDPATGIFTVAGSMYTTRQSFTTTLLNNGQVLVAAGIDYYANTLTSAELDQPSTLIPSGLVSISLNPTNPLVPLGGTLPYRAIGTFSDNSAEILASATWGSSDSTIAMVSNDASNQGNAFAVAAGSATISACTGSLCGSTTMTVVPPPSIISSSLPIGEQYAAYSATLAAMGGQSPYTWSISTGSLPAGLSLNASTGAITGTPTTTGTSNFTVQVTDSSLPANSATKALSVNITLPLVVTTSSLSSGTQSVAYSATLTASGGQSPYTWSISAGSLPSGLSLNSSTGTIIGIATTSGTTSFTVQVTDAQSFSAIQILSLTVNPSIAITTTSLNSGAQHVVYSANLVASGGTYPYHWAIAAGSLPPGLSLDGGAGIVSGIPTTLGTSSFTVQVVDANSNLATATLSLTIQPASPLFQLRVNDTPATVNLTAPLTLDWVVWGADGTTTAATRKVGTPIISDFTPVNTSNIQGNTYGYILYSWTDGTPIPSDSGVAAEVGAFALNSGFQITVPADTTVKTFNLYAGVHGSATLSASLSDGSSPAISDSSVHAGGEADKVYSIDFQAGSAGQTLTVTLTLTSANGYVALQAATLQPRVPQVMITSPAGGQSFTSGASVPVSAIADQVGASLANGSLTADGAQLFNWSAQPFTATWTGVAAGHHQLSAQATDSAGLVGTSAPVEFDAISNGGSLNVSLDQIDPSVAVDLTAEGTADWRLFTTGAGGVFIELIRPSALDFSAQASPDRTLFGTGIDGTVADPWKNNVASLISAYQTLGNHPSYTSTCCGPEMFSFTDGVPDNQETDVKPSVGVDGVGNGFQLTVAADTTPRTLRLYANAEYGVAKLQAFLSDGSAPAVIDESLDNPDPALPTVYAINFNAASANQSLTLRLTLQSEYDWGDIQIYAATLSGPSVPPVPHISSISPSSGFAGETVTFTGTGFGTSQGSSTVFFNGVSAMTKSWSTTSISAVVPVGAASGPVSVVTAGGTSNSDVTFTVAPLITTLNPSIGPVGTFVTLNGSGFGIAQGASTLSFNGVPAAPTYWSDSQIVAAVPAGVTTGGVQVLEGTASSNAPIFTVTASAAGGSPTPAPVLQLRTDTPPVSVSLADPVNLDWVVWGADGTTASATRKSGAGLISDISLVNTSQVSGDLNGFILYSWSGGTPIATGNGLAAEVSTSVQNGGFQVTAPADTTVKTLKLYAGYVNSAQLVASISDGSSPTISSSFVAAYTSPSVEQVYSIDFRAASASQTLTVQLLSTDPNGSVSLQAAVLQPHLPEVQILSPQDQQEFSSSATLTAGITATQYDSSIASAQIAGAGSSITPLQAAPFTWPWSPAPGHYILHGQATDSAGLTGNSPRTEVDVIGTGGSLSGSGVALNSSTVIDLTSEGTADWIVFPPRQSWNLPNDDDYSGTVRKAGVPPLISPYHPIARVASSGCGGAQFTFEDGLPDPQEAVGCYVSSSAASGSGFEFKVSADTTPRTLRLYLGAANAQGKLIAFLSDGSAPAILDESVQSNTVNTAFVYTINFSAASPGQTLTVRWLMDQAFDPYFGYLLYGSLSLYAATLNGPPAQAPIEITGVDPASGAVGTLVTITGTGFGASPGSVAIDGTPMNIVSWSDSSIVAAVASGTTTGTLTVQQGSNWAKGPTFTVYTLGGTPPSGLQVSPSSLNMLVGQSRTVSVTDNGQPVTHLGWATTNSNVVSLSSDDPPLITAVAPGTATVYAGDVQIAVTVYAGSSLPPGTPIWSVPLGSSSGPASLAPAAPSSSGVDVFALSSGVLSAIGTDGTVVWTANNIPSGAMLIPDFSGNTLLKTPYSYLDGQNHYHSTHVVQRLDPSTHQLANLYTFSDKQVDAPGYTFSDNTSIQAIIPHPAGLLFVQDNANVALFDLSTGNQLQSLSLESDWASVARMIVAGDGNAYLGYSTDTVSVQGDAEISQISLKLLKVSPDGTSATIELDQWTQTDTTDPWLPSGLPDGSILVGCGWHWTRTGEERQGVGSLSVITNADQGVAVMVNEQRGTVSLWSFCALVEEPDPNNPGNYLPPVQFGSQGGTDIPTTIYTGIYYASKDALISTSMGTVTGDLSASGPYGFSPVLQRQDGSYIGSAVGIEPPPSSGTSADLPMMAMAQGGGILWQQDLGTAVSPLYATSDGGAIATSTQPGSSQLGTLYTVNQSGTVTSQVPDTGAVLSWFGDWFSSTAGFISSVSLQLGSPGWFFDLAPSYAALQGGNASTAGSAPSTAGLYHKPRANAIRAAVAAKAINYVGSTNWLDYVDANGSHNQCNKFVHDILAQALAFPPYESDLRQLARYLLGRVDTIDYPALAKDWADPKKVLGCWETVPGGADQAVPGDVIAEKINYVDATGHVGIVVAPGETASADSTQIPPGLITISDYGFRADNDPRPTGHKSNAVVKRFVCQ